jgi:hypothetical protein
VRLLLISGVDIGSGALQRAIKASEEKGNGNIVRLLLKRGTGLDSDVLEEPMKAAEEDDYEKVVQLLEEHLSSTSGLRNVEAAWQGLRKHAAVFRA